MWFVAAIPFFAMVAWNFWTGESGSGWPRARYPALFHLQNALFLFFAISSILAGLATS
jgi:hypothetical protein